jgi:hypothetical protein
VGTLCDTIGDTNSDTLLIFGVSFGNSPRPEGQAQRLGLIRRLDGLPLTIEWSYAVFTTAEQILFARLGVFVGSYTLEAIEAVCGKRPQCANIINRWRPVARAALTMGRRLRRPIVKL